MLFLYSKKGKYISYEIGIEVSIKDIQLIYKVKKILGVGVVYFRKWIRNKEHIKEYIIPIFDKYP